jgi:hypothetical protein
VEIVPAGQTRSIPYLTDALQSEKDKRWELPVQSHHSHHGVEPVSWNGVRCGSYTEQPKPSTG